MIDDDEHRAAYVAYQQGAARVALVEGKVRAARLIIRSVRATDFSEDSAEAHLAVLRDLRSTPEEIEDAIKALITLTPTGPAGPR